MRFEDTTFRETVVELDGNQSLNCQFFRSKLVYRAEDTVAFDGCTFTECDWVVDGPAERMLYFLSALYRGLGPQGETLVEGIFDQVRTGTIGLKPAKV